MSGQELELRSKFNQYVSNEIQKYSLNDRENKILGDLRFNNINCERFVDVWMGANETLYDKIVDDLKRDYNLPQSRVRSLLQAKECDGKTTSYEQFIYNSWDANILYGVFGCRRNQYTNKFDVIVGIYKESFNVFDIYGRPINRSVLEKHYTSKALTCFSSNCKRVGF